MVQVESCGSRVVVMVVVELGGRTRRVPRHLVVPVRLVTVAAAGLVVMVVDGSCVSCGSKKKTVEFNKLGGWKDLLNGVSIP